MAVTWADAVLLFAPGRGAENREKKWAGEMELSARELPFQPSDFTKEQNHHVPR